MEETGTESRWIGRPVERKEDIRLVTGTGRYTDDIAFPNQLFCAILRSPVPHARIIRVDTTAATRMPGVVLALSGEDAKRHWNPLPAAVELPGTKSPIIYGLATDKVYFEGEPVAAVAAESRYVAEDALAAIDVEYDELPPVVTVEDALGGEGQAPRALLYEDWGDNIQLTWSFSFGDVQRAFREAHLVVKDSVRTHRYSGVPLEGRAVAADYQPRERKLTVHLSTQQPHQTRSLLARIFDLQEQNIRVIAQDVGGGFGNKGRVYVEIIPILLSILLGRPVKWSESRTEHLTTGPHARDYVHDIEMAFGADGVILGIRDHHFGDVGCDGAIRQPGAGSLVVGGLYTPGPYKVQNYHVSVTAVVSNKAPYGAYRGFGKDNANLGTEVILDRAARAFGIDPVEIRRRNLVDQFPYEMCTGPILESGSFRECLEELVALMDLPALRRRQQDEQDERRLLGIGVVSFLEPSGAAFPDSVTTGFESASVRMAADGSVTVMSGMQNIGQGVETAIAQVAADRLGCTPDEVRVICGDTDLTPFGLGSFSSRGAVYGLNAVYLAASQVRDKLLKAAALLLGVSGTEGVLLGEGAVRVKSTPERGVSLSEIAEAVYFSPGPYSTLPGEPNPTLEGHAVWTSPQVQWEPDEAGRTRMYSAHGSGAMGALVEVDKETGDVKVSKLWVVHDVGKMINPAIVEAQLRGGIVQGFGGAMMEEFKYDETGCLISRTLSDYHVPNILSVPPIEVAHVETPLPATPLGSKGGGEGGCIPTPTAIMLAVEDALRSLGARVKRTPFTPPIVFETVRAAPSITEAHRPERRVHD